MCMTYFVNKNALRNTGKPSRTQQISLNLKRNLFLINVVSFCCAGYFFMRHNSRCEPGGKCDFWNFCNSNSTQFILVYTLFALFEYVVVVTNMGFHLTSGYDFKDKWLIFDATNGLHFTSTYSMYI